MLVLGLALLLAPSGIAADNLRTEYRADPLGVDEQRPRLSWVVIAKTKGTDQSAYRVWVSTSAAGLGRGEADTWDSGKVTGNQTLGVEYNGPALSPATRYYWRVQLWDQMGGTSKPSPVAWWETGIGSNGWIGRWVSAPSLAAPYLRKEFDVEKPLAAARLYVTARGLYRGTIDGRRVGSGELTPGWTDFRDHLQYETYDVTSLLKRGANAIGLRLAPGWYSGHVGWTKEVYGKYPLALAQLQLNYRDGTSQTVVTDATWRASAGPILASDCQMGEDYDATKEIPGWDQPGFDAGAWSKVETEPLGKPILSARRGPLVTKLEELRAIRITEPDPGVFIFDLGQNMVGWARLRVSGPRGTQIQLRFGEMLDKDGRLYTKNLRGAKATDHYTLKGGGQETYEPSFTFHGFRYVEVTGYPGTPDLDAIQGEVVGSDIPQTGTFSCSDRLVNQLQHNIFWGQRGNYLDVPTDCPQRDERLGWMGDAETFIPTACFNNDVDAFMTKWMTDVNDGQSEEGAFADVSPTMHLSASGAPAWGDAGVIVPWNIYLAYGDRRLLDRCYSHMKAWVDFIDRNNPDHLWLNRRGNDYGDWLNVNDETPKEIVATAFFANSCGIVAKAAAALGKAADAEHYGLLHGDIRRAFHAAFVDPDAGVKGNTQTDYVLGIVFNLFNRGEVQRAGDHLVALIRDRKTHLSSGFVGVGRLMDALTMTGHTDVAYELLLTKTYPSWLYPVLQGATTIWERWDGWTQAKGFQNPGMNSFNHYSLGSVGDWLYTGICGISVTGGIQATEPNYSRLTIAPIVGNGLSWAQARFHSVAGLVASRWERHRDTVTFDITVPMNCRARITLPSSDGRVEGGAGATFDGHAASFEVAGGSYHFSTTVRN